MFKFIYHKFDKLYDKKIDGTGLAIFRIFYALVLLGEVCYIYYFRHLIFDEIAYVVPGEIDMAPIILIWIASLLFITFGLFTRTASIVNYVASVAVIGTASSYEYHMFYTYISVNFLLMFLPVSRCISLDRLIEKLKYSNTRFKYTPEKKVSVLAYYIPLLIGIGFVYFDSVFFKFSTNLWLSGLGLWLPGSLPQAVIFNNSFLLNIKPLIIGLGYLTLAFETIFIFVFFRKKWRIVTLLLGVGLHLGILLFFPIPFFALGVVAIYVLMVPVSFWQRLTYRKNAKQIKFYYDAECPLCARTIVAIEHFDSRGAVDFLSVQNNFKSEAAFKNLSEEELLTNIYAVDDKGKLYKGLDSYLQVLNVIWYLRPLSWILRFPGVYHAAKSIYGYVAINRTTERCNETNCGYIPNLAPQNTSNAKIFINLTVKQLKVKILVYGLTFLVIVQAIVTYTSPLSKVIRQKVGISKMRIVKITEAISNAVTEVSSVYLGFSHHGVFVDSHFNGYNHDIAVVYISPTGAKKWLPIIDQNGMPGQYLMGPTWAKWTFRVNSPLINQTKLQDGIRDFTSFWAHKHHVNLDNATFEIRVKKNSAPKEWEYDFLNNQLKNPWIPAGSVTWKNGQFAADIVDIEAL